MLLVEGDSAEDIQVLADPGRNVPVIIKDGTVCTNTLR
jgi:hypothetical protein